MPRHTSPRFWIGLAASALGVVALDQATKAWVLAHRAVLETARPTVGFTLVWNEAVAFSLPLRGPWVYLVAAAVLLIVVPTIARALDRTKAAGGMLLGFLLGGAAGNLIDRVRFDAVVDFVKVGWWPVFNVADAAISTSIVALILLGKFLFVPERAPEKAIKLGFDDRLLPLVLAGTKTVTFQRGARFATLRPGTELAAEHTQKERTIGRITLTSVREVRFGDISPHTPGHEPYADREAMRQDFQQWYPSLDITDDTRFWEIRFKLTSIDAHALQELEAHPLKH